MLSVVSLAHKNKVVPYSTIKTDLGMDNVRHLEDLIFDTMYSGMLQGKLDQREEVLKVITPRDTIADVPLAESAPRAFTPLHFQCVAKRPRGF